MATETTEQTVEYCAAHWRMDADTRCEECGHTKAEIEGQRRAERVTEYIAGLREIADWWEQHPEVEPPVDQRVLVYVQTKEDLADVARALGRAEKYGDDNWFGVKRKFGPIYLDAYGERQTVCTRIVKGTRTVTHEVPDPDATLPTITVTEEVEDVEWVCEPLLSVVDGGAT